MKVVIAAVLALLILALVPLSFQSSELNVGSKKFTESVILGEMIKLLVEEAEIPSMHYRELGGTRVVFDGLVNGEIDVYPEYTGTITEEILGTKDELSLADMRSALKKYGVLVSEPLGFNNTYVLGMSKDLATELGIEKISDLVRHPDLRFGFSNEFLDRQDGWSNLKEHYQLPQQNVMGLDHDLAYRQLKLGAIDVIDAYATDTKIEIYDLALLEDDLNYFPRYDAVLLYREESISLLPDAFKSILRLVASISEEEIMAANSRVEFDRVSESRAASEFLAEKFGFSAAIRDESIAEQILARTIEHLELVRRSLIPAILIAIPLGVLSARFPRFGHLALGVVGIFQTIPSLALLVILMPVMAWLGLASLGLGSATAITALFLYSLLPIVRNTHAGLQNIPSEHQEAAAALGLPGAFRLLEIELPLASSSILAGIKIAAVMNVGFATLGALIGAGGYGQPIVTGMRLADTSLILQGAIPAALLALLVQGGFEFGEQYLVPRGLRLERA